MLIAKTLATLALLATAPGLGVAAHHSATLVAADSATPVHAQAARVVVYGENGARPSRIKEYVYSQSGGAAYKGVVGYAKADGSFSFPVTPGSDVKSVMFSAEAPSIWSPWETIPKIGCKVLDADGNVIQDNVQTDASMVMCDL